MRFPVHDRPKKPRQRRLFLAELSIFPVILIIFVVKLANYFGIEAFRLDSLSNALSTSINKQIEYVTQSHYLGRCPDSQIKIIIRHSYVCRDNVGVTDDVRIFDTYDKLPDNREFIYGEVTRGDPARAQLLIEENRYDFGRTTPAKITQTHWNEDPYNDRYWRFNYYGLQILNDIVTKYEQTKDPRYKQKAQSLIESFATVGINAPHSWDDYHAVAFRSMSLVNYWWKMREMNALDITTSTHILRLLTLQGQFLADRNHFEAANNHGVNEAAALLLIANSFPTLKQSAEWKTLSLQRIDDTLNDLIDSDGVLIENSPFYHFYILRKYWNIYTYTTAQRISVTPLLKQKLDKMVRYATYILQPNLHPPTIGASLDAEIFYNDEYEAIAREYPAFKHVLTRGKYGATPPNRTVAFMEAGQAILRNSFTGNFNDHVQAILQAGDYRSDHSHLDALSLTLSSGSDRLLVDAGLYAYESSDVSDYFQGTLGHNTVVVDGKNQRPGNATIISVAEHDNYTTASAVHELYTGVTHNRSVSMIGSSTFIIYDTLSSKSRHTYTQIFHFDPNISVSKTAGHANSITGRVKGSGKTFTIKQLGAINDTTLIQSSKKGAVGGYCATEYAKLLLCPQVNFTAAGDTIRFVTVVELKNDSQQYTLTDNSLAVATRNKREYTFRFTETSGESPSMTKAKTSPVPASPAPPPVGIVIKNADSTATYIQESLGRRRYPAIVSVPARQLAQHYADTLSRSELQRLQRDSGWEIVNQGFSINDDLSAMLSESRPDDYAADIIRGAHAYREMSLTPSSLWFAQSAGTLSPQASRVASDYYPLVLPLDETSTPDASPQVVAVNVTGNTTVELLKQKIEAAAAQKQTLLLIFTRFSRGAEEQGFSLANFEQLLQYMDTRSIKPATLTGIAHSLGYKAETDTAIQPGRPLKVTLESKATNHQAWYEFWH